MLTPSRFTAGTDKEGIGPKDIFYEAVSGFNETRATSGNAKVRSYRDRHVVGVRFGDGEVVDRIGVFR